MAAPPNGGGRSFLLDFLLRSLTTALLALGITGAAVYEVVVQHRFESPLVNWGGIIVGVYFGSVVATRGEDRRRRSDVNGAAERG